MTTPFDFVNAICDSKRDLIAEDEANEKEYNPFIVNRGLSYFPDTIMYANEMNQNNFLDKRTQFNFLINSISKKKRFSKWNKKDTRKELSLIVDYYGCSMAKAKEYLDILSPEQLEQIEKHLFKGGKT